MFGREACRAFFSDFILCLIQFLFGLFRFPYAGTAAAGIVHPALEFIVDLYTGGIQIQTCVADGGVGIRALASQLAGRADVHTSTT